MKTAEEILKEHTIKYGGIDYVDFDHALTAMKIYANSKLDEAAEVAYQDTHDGYAAPSVKRHVLSLKDTI